MLSILRVIIKDASAITAVKLTAALASLLSLPIVTDALSVEDYAKYEFILLFVLPLQVIIGLNIENGILRYWADFKLGYQVLKNLLKFYSVVFVLVFAISSTITGFTSATTILVTLAFASLCWQSLCLYLRLSDELPTFYIISVVPNIAWLAFLSMASSLNIDAILFSKVVCLSIAVIAGTTIGIAKRIPIANALTHLDLDQNKRILKFSASLIPSIVLVWLLNISDRYLISILRSDQDLALYSLHFRVAMGFKIFVAVSRQTWSKLFFATSLVERSTKSVNVAINIIILSAIFIVPVYLFLADVFIELFIINTYGFDLFIMLAILLSLLMSIIYTLCCTMYLQNDKTGTLLAFNFAIACTNYILSYFFISFFGIIGAPLGSIIALGCISFFMQWNSDRNINKIFLLTALTSMFCIGLMAV